MRDDRVATRQQLFVRDVRCHANVWGECAKRHRVTPRPSRNNERKWFVCQSIDDRPQEIRAVRHSSERGMHDWSRWEIVHPLWEHLAPRLAEDKRLNAP